MLADPSMEVLVSQEFFKCPKLEQSYPHSYNLQEDE